MNHLIKMAGGGCALFANFCGAVSPPCPLPHPNFLPNPLALSPLNVPAYGPQPNALGPMSSNFNQEWLSGVWTPDRRPMAFISLFQSGPEQWKVNGSNPYALQTWWYNISPTDPRVDVPVDVKSYTKAANFIDGPVSNPQGNGVPDQFDELLWRMDRAYFAGFRRIVLKEPSGSSFGREYPLTGQPSAYAGHDVHVNHWWPMNQWKRDYFAQYTGAFQQWRRANSDADIEIYGGLPLTDNFEQGCSNAPSYLLENSDPNNPPPPVSISTYWLQEGNSRRLVQGVPTWFTNCGFPNAARPFDPRLPQHINYMYKAIDPWINLVGVKGIWFDGAAANTAALPYRYGFMNFAYEPYYRSLGIRFGGEALPTTDNDGLVLDVCALKLNRWMALEQAFFTDSAQTQWKPNWTFTKQMEPHFVIATPGDMTPAKWAYARYNRMVVSTFFARSQDPKAVEDQSVRYFQRWYSMGVFCPLDFNGDGIIQYPQDFDAAVTVIVPHVTNPPPVIVFATGDINGDGEVTPDDIADLSDLFTDYNATGNVPLRDYGAPDDL
jgi:hypothetical protein